MSTATGRCRRRRGPSASPFESPGEVKALAKNSPAKVPSRVIPEPHFKRHS